MACGLAVYAFFLGGYAVLNRSIPLGACRDFATTLDREMPFVPEFIWPFYLAYLAVLLPCALAPDRRALAQTTAAFLLLVSIAFALFMLVPVTVPRPVALPDSIAGRWIGHLYAADRPVCAFPSLHVSTMVVATAALFRARRVHGWLILPITVAASLATLLVKQHVIADVAGGLVLALAVDWFVHSGPGSKLVARCTSARTGPDKSGGRLDSAPDSREAAANGPNGHR